MVSGNRDFEPGSEQVLSADQLRLALGISAVLAIASGVMAAALFASANRKSATESALSKPMSSPSAGNLETARPRAVSHSPYKPPVVVGREESTNWKGKKELEVMPSNGVGSSMQTVSLPEGSSRWNRRPAPACASAARCRQLDGPPAIR